MSSPAQTAREIFNDAVENVPQEQWPEFLDCRCKDDSTMRRRVQRLLEAHADAGDFMQRPPADPFPTMDLSLAEKPGTQIGPYKLMEKIGEGGMGVVYVAAQERPMRRRVALKVIKPGMDSKEVVARFTAERQALALMDHPNIAKVHDAGTTDSGRPYFVMELVRGIPITEYCDLNRINARQRLELFVFVCQAVQHAHQKSVIHRDLKPSNVLVTEHDGTPVVKVIDFGVAKAINQQLTERTIYTRFQQMVGTPMYMSPEQAELSGLDVDTRSDIYSLGVLLYELLTGETPFDKRRFSEAAYDEIRRIIREEEPSKPSTKVRTLGKTAAAISGYRSTDQKKLSQILRGDLDWIVMKSLEKDRNRRYDTAKGLANDIARHLNDEPVVARPPSATYQFQKFARRHKALFISTALVSFALLAGMAVATWMAILASNARDAARRAQAEQELLASKEASARKEAVSLASKEAAARQAAQMLAEKEALARVASRQLLYASDMTLAQYSLNEGNDARVAELLARHEPNGSEQDLRHFEWYHLKWKSRQRWQLAMQLPYGALRGRFTPGEDLLTVVHPSGRITLHHAAAGTLVTTFEMEDTQWPTLAAISPDGKTIAYRDDETDVVLHQLDVGTIHRFPHDDTVSSLAFSSDGRLLAVSVNNEPITVWDISDRTVYKVLEHQKPLNATTPWNVARKNGLVFSPDGNLLIVVYVGRGIAIWDLRDSTLLYQFASRHHRPFAAAFSHDGRRLAVVRQSEVDLYHMERLTQETGVELLRSRGKAITSVAFSPNNRLLVVGHLDGTIDLWDVTTATLRETLYGHAYNVTFLIFSNDGATLYSGSLDQSVRAWDLTQHDESPALTLDGPILELVFSRDGQQLAIRTVSKTRIWSPHSGEVTLSPIESIYNNSALCRNWEAASTSVDGTISLWNLEGGQLQKVFDPVSESRSQRVSLSPDGMLVSTLHRDGTLQTWDRRTSVEKTSTAQCDALHLESPVVISPGAKFLAVGHRDGTVSLWEPSPLALVRRLRLFDQHVSKLAFAENLPFLAATSNYGEIALWNFETEELIGSWQGHSGVCTSLCFSHDGRRLFTGGIQGFLKAWDIPAGQEVFSLDHGYRVQAIAVSPDGVTLATGTWGTSSEPPMVRLWPAPGLPRHHKKHN